MRVRDSAIADCPLAFWRTGVVSIKLVPALVCILLFLSTANTANSRTVVVKNDRGGSVIERALLIQQYQTDGTYIEIRGNYCLSACTMYLGMQNTCVAPNTRFGFHGPGSRVYGIALRPESFQLWSQLVAEHYPAPLRKWYLDKGRHRIVGFYEFSGRDLIRMGVQRC